MVLEKTLESPLDCKKIKPVNPKGNQSYVWERCWERLKGMIEDEMGGWHQQLSGPKFKQTQRDSDGHRSLAAYSPWGCKELNTTE